MRVLAPALRPLLAHGDAGHVVVEVRHVHGAQGGERTALHALVEGDLQRVPVLIGLRHAHACRAAALELQREAARLGIEGDLPDLDDRPPLHLDRPDQEGGPEGGRRHAGGRQGPQAPVAVLRIEHQHLLPAHGPDHPHLQQVHALRDALADAHRGGGRAPEGGEREAHHPQLDVLVERGAARRLRGTGRGVAGGTAAGPVGLEAVALQGADVGRVRGLDAQAAHVPGGQVDGDVVLLGAQHRLAGVRHLHGERLGRRRRAAGPVRTADRAHAAATSAARNSLSPLFRGERVRVRGDTCSGAAPPLTPTLSP